MGIKTISINKAIAIVAKSPPNRWVSLSIIQIMRSGSAASE
ncbi:uncharacterized protein METZ01_LOCUS158285 [marine metagenome]|uniref:Uncharacterized protein n=1 Tax=marine metagenome TaxID=408172 RepID=A0A382AVV3_9ZZZZ